MARMTYRRMAPWEDDEINQDEYWDNLGDDRFHERQDEDCEAEHEDPRQ